MKATALSMFVAVLALVTPSIAQDFNPLEKTYLTFSGPVELPGVSLPAGTYTFKLADTPSRNVVQVLSRDEKTVHGQFLFVQATRRDATGEPVVMFKETAEGTTPAVQYWYYPGETIGKEFVYPKDQALKIAARTHERVLASEGGKVTTIDESGKSTAFEAQPAPAPQQQARADVRAPEPAPVTPPAAPAPAAQAAPQPAPPVTQPAPQPPPASSAAATERTELPQTASPVPLIALLGLVSMAAGLGMHIFVRRPGL
jgi:hypothetical protein